ncbi:hypothetical protein BGZ83_005449 [Gryganskiella cystojenkinii]|nr:hypothetical protein BGZ83_005449 [Gryganskiella cystojenkinii]
MASNNSRLSPGGVSGLASSLRSAANNGSVTSPIQSHFTVNNNSNNNNGHQNGDPRRQYSRDTDSRVPDEDDSTEEDEDYRSYVQGQGQQQHQHQNQNHGTIDHNKAMSARQMLRDSSDDEDMHDHPAKSTMDIVDPSQQQQQGDITNNILVQNRQNQILDDSEEDFDEDDEDMEEDGSDTLSLTEDDIDFNLVYAFHTFVATQEGQASVVRNDALMLLEDVNVYWWLVRVLKTGVIGYIPAENIETPFERLARLNKYRNVGLSAPTAEWGMQDETIQPLDPAKLAADNPNRRSVIFTNINEYFGASENEWDDEDEDGEEDDEMGEYYEGNESDGGSEQDKQDEQQQQQHEQDAGHSGKSVLQLEAERVEQEILQEQKLQQSALRNDYGNDATMHSGGHGDEEDENSRRYRRPLLDDDDLLYNDEPRKISLTPSIAQDDSIIRIQTPPGRAKKLRLADEESLNSMRSGGSPTQMSRQNQQSPGGENGSSYDSDEEDRQLMQKRSKEAKLEAILAGQSDRDSGASSPAEDKKPGRFKSLFGVVKGSKDKEKERKEKERQENERRARSAPVAPNRGSSSVNNSPGGHSMNSNGNMSSPAGRSRTNSSGSVGSFNTNTTAGSNGPMSPGSLAESSDSLQQEIVALRVYPGNVDFGVSMYKTVVVSPTTMASDVAGQAVIKFKLAPENVPASAEFFLTVRGLDGDEIVLQPTDKPMAIYQSLTSHLTTPLPANHRLSISSMMSIESTSSYTSNPPSTPTSPSSVKRLGSGGRSDPNQRSIRFYLNKKIRRASSISSVPGTPTTPTTPIHDDMFWVKVVCQAQDLPLSMIMLDGLGNALDKSDPQAQGQNGAAKIEHWISMHSTANAGDVVFKSLELIDIRSGVVDGVPEHVIASKRETAPNGLVFEYQLGLLLNGQTSRRAKQGDELPLPPQMPLIRCFEEHQLTPVRRSPKADVASMPLNPDHVFFLRKSVKSRQAEIDFEHEQDIRDAIAKREMKQQAQPKKPTPAPLNFQSQQQQPQQPHRTPSNDALRSPTAATSPSGMTSPRSLRSLRSFDDTNGAPDANVNGPASPGLNQNRMGHSPNLGPLGPRQTGGSPMQGVDGNIRIPRRTDSVVMGPTSPIRENHPHHHQQSLTGSRTPTPDHGPGGVMGRNRSGSVSQGIRSGQTPSPSLSSLLNPGGGDQDAGSKSSTPERPARPDRADRQRAISPSMTHAPSPLSLASVVQRNVEPSSLNNGHIQSKIAPLNIKKNETQGTDIILDKGVIRSSRLLPSKQYRYSFIPQQGGEEVDISDIIEDILGEENGGDDDLEDQHIATMASAASGKERGTAFEGYPARSASNGSRASRISLDRDGLEVLTNSARGGSTLLKLERVLASTTETEAKATQQQQQYQQQQRQQSTSSRTNSPATSHQETGQPRTLASPLSLNSSPSLSHKRSDSDVEIQTASFATLTTRSASPMIVDQQMNGSRGGQTTDVGSRPQRAASPFGFNKSRDTNNGGMAPSPLKDNLKQADQSQDNAAAQSLSSLPRRLQTPSPANMRQNTTPSPRMTSTDSSASTPISTAAPTGGRSSAMSVRSNSGASITSVTSARARSASSSAASSERSRVAQLNGGGSGKEWLLSSDYNSGMKDLLTLVRAGRSSSVSSPPSSSSMISSPGGANSPSSTFSASVLRGSGGNGGLNGPIFGKDGRIVALPSTMKASLLNSKAAAAAAAAAVAATSRNRTGSVSEKSGGSFDGYKSTTSTTSTKDGDLNEEGAVKNEEQARMVLMMLNELTLKDVQQECHPDVYDCWKDVDADLDRVERELDDLLVTVKSSNLNKTSFSTTFVMVMLYLRRPRAAQLMNSNSNFRRLGSSSDRVARISKEGKSTSEVASNLGISVSSAIKIRDTDKENIHLQRRADL